MHQVFNYVEVLKWAFPAMKEKGLSPTERFLFLYLLHRANTAYWRELRLSVATVIAESGLKHSTFFLAKRNLQEKGFLREGKGCLLNYVVFSDSCMEEKNKKKERLGTPARDYSPEERLADLEKFFGKKI